MSDPLSVTASVVGTVGALLHGSKRLYEFIDSLKNAPKDIAALSTDLRALYEILAHITRAQDRLSSHHDLCVSLRAPLENCLNIFDEFMTLLQGFTQISRDGTVKVRVWKQMTWAFKDKEIQLFRDTITTYKVSLDMALNAMTFSAITSLNEQTVRFETNFKEEFKDIRSRLQAFDSDRIELASVKVPNASFPGSPAQPPSEDDDELGTKEGTQGTESSRQPYDYISTVTSSRKKALGLYYSTAATYFLSESDLDTYSKAFNLLDDLASFALNSQSPSSNQHPPGSSQALKMSYPAMNQDAEVDQQSMDDALSPKSSPEFIYNKAKPQTPIASADPIIPGLKDIYSKSGFDAVKVLWLIATRRHPQFNIGAIDMSCSFVVCDITLEDCPIVYISDSFQTLTGYSLHEALGRNCRFLQAPDGKVERGSTRQFVDDGAVQTLKKNVQERRETQISMINYHKGGKPFLNYLSIIPIPWDTNEIRYYVGFQIDLVESPTAIVPRDLWPRSS